MNFRDYFGALSRKEQESFAKRAGTTAGYIRCHLASDPPRKIPRKKLLDGLAKASGGDLTRSHLVEYFYGDAA